MPPWDDVQYLKFGDERTRAARELLARVPLERAEHVLDLGCGPGNSTSLLRERWPEARIVGVDSSLEMLTRARAGDRSIEWIHGDLRTFEVSPTTELVFANAVLQWLPDHGPLLSRLLSRLPAGGVLALQMPYNFEEPSHRLMREARQRLLPELPEPRGLTPVASPAFYYELFAPQARRVDIWRTTYEHVMADADAIVEWVKGTGLRPYIEDLAAPARQRFLAEYTSAVERAYPERSDGKRLFSFPRLFIVVVR